MRLESDIEAGPVREDELDTMLEIMCEAFEMPYAAARTIFYADPYFSLPNKRVLRVGGRVVSCLTLIEAQCWIGKSIVPMLGIAGVATLKVRRGRGYAGRLLEATLQDLRQQGCAFTALIPFSFRYYRKFGWELAGLAYRVRVAPVQLRPSAEARRVRPATDADVEPLRLLYARLTERRTFHCLRDAPRWRYILEHVKQSVVYEDNQGQIQGYLLSELLPGRIEQLTPPVTLTPTLRILELRSATPEAQRGLLGHLAEQRQAGQILFTSTLEDLSACGLLSPDHAVNEGNTLGTVEIIPIMMTRIVRLRRMLETLLPNWADIGVGEEWEVARLEIRMSDPQIPSGQERVVLAIRPEGGITLAEPPSRTRPEAPAASIAGDVKTWSQVVAGYLGAEEACARGLLSASSGQVRTLATRLFPPRSPFLPAPDHF
ncbi:MAG TPA: GNAT family N-acetyltransferase [Chthonomonadaceae bacterium]|nr:GNAT family N-acetyltransferase [Chthonomonadaceae bacterium]